MIPSLQKIKKKSKPIEQKPYFSLTEEYLELKKKFEVSYFELFLLFVDMLYPLYIFYQILLGEHSIMFVFALTKSYQVWGDLFRYLYLQEEIESWIFYVKCLGGPWISTNNSDYHLFVYADAMERIYLSHVGLPKN